MERTRQGCLGVNVDEQCRVLKGAPGEESESEDESRRDLGPKRMEAGVRRAKAEWMGRKWKWRGKRESQGRAEDPKGRGGIGKSSGGIATPLARPLALLLAIHPLSAPPSRLYYSLSSFLPPPSIHSTSVSLPSLNPILQNNTCNLTALARSLTERPASINASECLRN